MHKGHFLGGNWIELSLKDRYLRKGYYVGLANRSGCQSDSCCHGDACARDSVCVRVFSYSILLDSLLSPYGFACFEIHSKYYLRRTTIQLPGPRAYTLAYPIALTAMLSNGTSS